MYGKDYPISVQVLDESNRRYVEDFFCDNSAIDNYFRRLAVDDKQAVTYIFIDEMNDAIIACVTLACSAIFLKEAKKQFSTIVSAMEIQYFAVDEEYKHIKYEEGSSFTLSYYILVYMLDLMKELSHTSIGAAKIILYSVPEAINFYKKCRFSEFGEGMLGDKGEFVEGCLPMYLDIN